MPKTTVKNRCFRQVFHRDFKTDYLGKAQKSVLFFYAKRVLFFVFCFS